MRETKVPAIPEVTSSNLAQAVSAIKHTLEVREGRAGDPLDQLVTFRELQALGLVAPGSSSAVPVGGTGLLPVVPVVGPGAGGFGPDDYNSDTDLTTPPAPTDLTAIGGYTSIFLEWTGTNYRNHAYTEIWRNAIDELGTAQMIGTSIGNLYADQVGTEKTYYYWVRFVSRANVTGPYNMTSGTMAKTALDVERRIEILREEIINDPFTQFLGERIKAIEYSITLNDEQLAILNGARSQLEQEMARYGSGIVSLESVTSTQATSIKLLGTRVGNAESLITNLQTTTADQALSLTQLTTRVGDAESNIVNLQTTSASQAQLITDLNTSLTQKNRVFAQATAPVSTTAYTLVAGDQWIDTDDGNKLYRWTGSAWELAADTRIAEALELAQATSDGGIISYFQATAPTGLTATDVGDLWFDTDDSNKIYRWSGSAWVAAQDNRIAQALLDAADAQATADGKVKTFFQNTPPTAEGVGDLWIDTDDSNKLYRWSGSAWTPISDTRIAQALADAATAQATADGKINSYYQASAPTGLTATDVGDLWFDTDDNNKIYRWNGSAWLAAQDSRIAQALQDASDAQATADGKVTAFFQDAPPTATGVGDLWFDTNDNYASYRWNGSQWVGYRSANRVFYQTIAPVGTSDKPLLEGDVWFDSDDDNHEYRYNGTAWVSVRDGYINARVTTLEQTKIGYATLNSTGQVFDNGGLIKDKSGVDAWNLANPGNPATWNVGLPFATAVKQVAVSDGASSLTLEQRFTAQKTTNDGLLGQYSIKIDNNGHVSGFGLASTTTTAGPTSAFIVRADRFAIVGPNDTTDPLGTTTPTNVPFVVLTTTQTIGGLVYPPGVWIKAAFIADATITNAKITDLSAEKITAGTITASLDIRAPKIRSANIAPGAAGFYLGESGGLNQFYIGNGDTGVNGRSLQFDGTNAIVRGLIYAYGGTIGGNTLGSDYIQSSNFVAGSAGWRLKSDGSAEIGSASIRGLLTASQIDTRGLSIKDASGNIILAAGSPLATSNISGLGTLATQNSVDYSSVTGTKPPSNATANTIYRQTTDPGGANGDIWVDTSVTPNLTKVKIGGVWQTAANNVTAASQIGAVATDLSNAPAGILNSNITLATLGYTSLQGAGAPAAGLGVQGDNYWDTTNAILYYKTGASTWTRVSPNITSSNVSTYIANGAIGSAQVGTLTAGNIDTRGLLIRDNDNNILFGAGYALNWNNVGGNKPVQWRVKSEGNSAGTGSGVWNMDTGTQVAYHSRSYNLVRINRSTGALIAATNYDVYGNGAAGQTLANTLNSLTSAEIIVLYTADEPRANRLLYDLPQALYRCGASPEVFGRGDFKNRAAYILIGSPGIGKGNGYEAYRGDKNDDVNSKLDVTFTIQNGTFMVSGLKANNAIPSSDFVQYLTYDFNNSTNDWGAANTTVTLYPYYINLTASNNNGMAAQTPIIAIVGAQYNVIRARIRRKAGTGWRGYCYYSTAFHGMSESYKKVIPDPTVMDEWVIAEWNMAELTDGGTDWTTNTVTQFRLDLGVILGDSFDVDWISVGRIGPLKLDSSNIRTYIADLSVDTLQIAGNAVTVPAGTTRSTALDLTDGAYQLIMSTTMNTGGSPMWVFAKLPMSFEASSSWDLQIRADSTVLYTESRSGVAGSFWDGTSGGSAVVFIAHYVSAPPSGTFTLAVYGRGDGYYNTDLGAGANIFAIGTKR